MPTDRTLLIAACVCFALAVPQFPSLSLHINLVALGLALGTLTLLLR